MIEAQWIVVSMLIPLAVALWREREKRLKAEWECAELKRETSEAVEQLHKATRELIERSRTVSPSRLPSRGPVRTRRRVRR